MKAVKLLVLLATACALEACSRNTSLPPKAPDGLADFTLLDHEGRSHSLYRKTDAKAVVIIGQGNSCPIIQKYSQRIRELAVQYGGKDVEVLLINANTQDTRKAIAKEATEFNYGAPILMDPSQVVTRSLGITRTAEAVIVEPEIGRAHV